MLSLTFRILYRFQSCVAEWFTSKKRVLSAKSCAARRTCPAPQGERVLPRAESDILFCARFDCHNQLVLGIAGTQNVCRADRSVHAQEDIADMALEQPVLCGCMPEQC